LSDIAARLSTPDIGQLASGYRSRMRLQPCLLADRHRRVIASVSDRNSPLLRHSDQLWRDVEMSRWPSSVGCGLGVWIEPEFRV